MSTQSISSLYYTPEETQLRSQLLDHRPCQNRKEVKERQAELKKSMPRPVFQQLMDVQNTARELAKEMGHQNPEMLYVLPIPTPPNLRDYPFSINSTGKPVLSDSIEVIYVSELLFLIDPEDTPIYLNDSIEHRFLFSKGAFDYLGIRNRDSYKSSSKENYNGIQDQNIRFFFSIFRDKEKLKYVKKFILKHEISHLQYNHGHASNHFQKQLNYDMNLALTAGGGGGLLSLLIAGGSIFQFGTAIAVMLVANRYWNAQQLSANFMSREFAADKIAIKNDNEAQIGGQYLLQQFSKVEQDLEEEMQKYESVFSKCVRGFFSNFALQDHPSTEQRLEALKKLQ